MKLKFGAAAVCALLICGAVFIFSARPSVAVGGPRWVTVDAKEFAHVREIVARKGGEGFKSLVPETEVNGIALVELEEAQMEDLSREMHAAFEKCSGFMAFETRADALESIASFAAVDPNRQFVDYTINNQTNVNALLAEASEPQNRQVIIDLAAFPNRRYNQQSGLDSANWIKNKWTSLAAGRSDVTVDFYNHPTATSPQPSVIMTIQGTTTPSEIVVIGGHQDSINGGGQTLSAPGADDDASGIASLTETIRVLMAKGFRPNRTVKFMAYAAEEVGLRGSAAIALDFRNQNLNVVGVLQLDMTNYKGSPIYDIVLIQDFTNAAQNTFVTDLVTTYQPGVAVGTASCGYACSDHASWTNRQYPASMPFEATLANDNPTIHTANDLLSQSGGNANHAVKFTKLALSFVGELAKGAIAPTRKPVVDFDGDSKTDVSIFRPSNGEWWINKSGTNSTVAAQFGATTDTPVPADFTGDGKADIAFFRPSTGFWYILRSEDASFFSFPFGATGDTPLVGDFDGDGKSDPAVYRGSNNTWYISKTTGGTSIVTFGAAGDKAVPADFDGDAKADIAIFRPSTGEWWINRSATGVTIAAQFGLSTDKPVAGDYTGDGKADIAFFRPSTGFWFILRSEDASFFSFPFGASTDLPVPGDYDGDGKLDAAVFRASDTNWYLNRSTAGVAIQQFGAATDSPLPNLLLP